jgi:hypothetical protein
MNKIFKYITVSVATFCSLGFMLVLIDHKAHDILTDRQREIIYRLRDSIYTERTKLFKVDFDKHNTYTFKQSQGGYSTYYSVKISENTEGVTLQNPKDKNSALKISKKAMNDATHLISYNKQGNFQLDDSKLVAFASKKIFKALSESKSIKIKIDDLPESILKPLFPENPYTETYFSSVIFETNGSVVLPKLNLDSFPVTVKVDNKEGIPQLLKGSYAISNYETLNLWVLNDPNYPLIVKMSTDANFELKEISKH